MALLLILPTLSHTLPNTFPNPSSSPHPLLPHNLITIYFTGYAVWSKTPNVTQHTPLSQFRIRNHLRLNRMLPGIYYSLNLNISKNWPISYYKVSPPQIPYQEMNQCYRTSENISIPPRTRQIYTDSSKNQASVRRRSKGTNFNYLLLSLQNHLLDWQWITMTFNSRLILIAS